VQRYYKKMIYANISLKKIKKHHFPNKNKEKRRILGQKVVSMEYFLYFCAAFYVRTHERTCEYMRNI